MQLAEDGKEVSTDNVLFLKTNSGKKGEGMPVVRNPQFYFKEGFCWNNVLTTYLKCKKKEKTVQSTESMSLFSCSKNIPEYFFVCLLNSKITAQYVDSFINSTSHCTTGDAKLIPVVIPTEDQLEEFKRIFHKAYKLKESVAKNITTDSDISQSLADVEILNDHLIFLLYSI